MDFPVENIYYSPEFTNFSNPQVMANYPMDYNWYHISCMKKCPFGNDFFYVIVATYTSSKVNVYGTYNEFNPYNLVKYYTPISLIAAQTIFPEMGFNQQNYGFEKLKMPDELIK